MNNEMSTSVKDMFKSQNGLEACFLTWRLEIVILYTLKINYLVFDDFCVLFLTDKTKGFMPLTESTYP